MKNAKSCLIALALCAANMGGYATQSAKADDVALAAATVEPSWKDTEKQTEDMASHGSLKVARFELATGVDKREPTVIATTFESGQKVYAFLELKNKGGPETAVFVRFERDGSKPGQGIRLVVPATGRHRTFAFSASTKYPGTYRCVVTAEDGTVLMEKSYEVTKKS